MNREEISRKIGVGEPYLWIDEAIIVDDHRIHARKQLDPGLPVFQSHYVGFPLFPGALQCEAAFQAASLLIANTQPSTPGCVPVIARVNNVKFRRMARPGETMDVEVEILDRTRLVISLKGRISVGGQTTTELEFLATEAKTGS